MGISLRFTVGCGGVKPCLLLYSWPGEFWKIGLQLGAGWWLKTLYVACVGRSMSHLFAVCDFAWRVWCLCFEWLGVSFVIHLDPMQNFIQFRLSQASVSVNDVWGTIWVGIVSEIWKHRNSVVFNGGVTNVLEVFVSAQVKVWSWIVAKSREVYFSYPYWVLDPLACIRLIW